MGWSFRNDGDGRHFPLKEEPIFREVIFKGLIEDNQDLADTKRRWIAGEKKKQKKRRRIREEEKKEKRRRKRRLEVGSKWYQSQASSRPFPLREMRNRLDPLMSGLQASRIESFPWQQRYHLLLKIIECENQVVEKSKQTCFKSIQQVSSPWLNFSNDSFIFEFVSPFPYHFLTSNLPLDPSRSSNSSSRRSFLLLRPFLGMIMPLSQSNP